MFTDRSFIIEITPATQNDFSLIANIYAYYVNETTSSLEEVAPSPDEMLMRWRSITEQNLPYIVAKIEGTLVGYAYACPYRSRSGYRYTVEESIYVHPDHHGKGIGKALLQSLINQCSQKNFRQMIAIIAGSDNLASLHLHKQLGFSMVGILQKVGFKKNQWIDTTIMQKNLVEQ